jgi:hypothetical protein
MMLEIQVTRDAASKDIFEAEGVGVMGIQAGYGMSRQEAYIGKDVSHRRRS